MRITLLIMALRLVGQLGAQPVGTAWPGLFRLQPNVSAQAYAVNQDGTINSQSSPASPGSVVALWGTGFGPLDSACATGGLNPPEAAELAPGYSAIFEQYNVIFEDAPVVYAGSAPTLLCGVVQINIQIPTIWTPGAYLFQPEAEFSSRNGSTTAALSPIGSTIFVK
jgi:uncharacterized protein (TIGR03437 family)